MWTDYNLYNFKVFFFFLMNQKLDKILLHVQVSDWSKIQKCMWFSAHIEGFARTVSEAAFIAEFINKSLKE